MIKKTILGLVLACAACCAVPLVLPAIAGLSVMGFSLFGREIGWDAVLCALPLAGLAFIAAYGLIRYLRPKKAGTCAKSTCATAGSCGCK